MNTTGSFILAFFLIWTTERVLSSAQWHLVITVGFCGSFTTFSSYTFETFKMMEQGRLWDATANFFAYVLCLNYAPVLTLLRSASLGPTLGLGPWPPYASWRAGNAA